MVVLGLASQHFHLSIGAGRRGEDMTREALLEIALKSLYIHIIQHSDDHPAGPWEYVEDEAVETFLSTDPSVLKWADEIADQMAGDDEDGPIAVIVVGDGEGELTHDEFVHVSRSLFELLGIKDMEVSDLLAPDTSTEELERWLREQ